MTNVNDNGSAITLTTEGTEVAVRNSGVILGATKINLDLQHFKQPEDIIDADLMVQLHTIQSDVHAAVAHANGINMQDYQVLDNLVFAFFVELGEVANEIEFFKHWKKEKRDNKKVQLEEVADLLAFLMAICDVKGYQKIIREARPFEFYEDAEFMDMFLLLKRLELATFQDVQQGFSLVLGIAKKLGFTVGQVVSAYLEKSGVNIERQESGY